MDGQLAWWLAAAFALRLAMIAYGCWHDAAMPVKYTDVDYEVFTDAALRVCAGRSPYDRQTYRYPPTLAVLLTPNCLWKPFGKVLFAAADVACGLVLVHLCRLTRSPVKTVYALWLLNPVVINVSTRGNADALVLLPLTLSLLCHTRYLHRIRGEAEATNSTTEHGKPSLCVSKPGKEPAQRALDPSVAARAAFSSSADPAVSGCLLAVAVHLRLFPVIFLPSVVAAYAVARQGGAGSAGGAAGFRLSRVDFRALFAFGLSFAGSLALSTGGCCFAGGAWSCSDFLQNAYFYHYGRTDHRHNLCPHWLPAGLPGGFVFGGFLPQAVSITALSARYCRHPSFAWLLAALVFVTLNKVATVQYFTWYLCFLPPATSYLQGSRRLYASLAAFWLLCLALWLGTAYTVEFRGEAHFVSLWACSLLFLVANAAVVCSFICTFDSRPVESEGGKLD
ncbi:GPI mannosyltransferase 1 [Diplonema papillatum]|nr:GPI mannosyltransferase 1 [Diplonema papillatum]|eukprot:gene15379-23515_t